MVRRRHTRASMPLCSPSRALRVLIVASWMTAAPAILPVAESRVLHAELSAAQVKADYDALGGNTPATTRRSSGGGHMLYVGNFGYDGVSAEAAALAASVAVERAAADGQGSTLADVADVPVLSARMSAAGGGFGGNGVDASGVGHVALFARSPELLFNPLADMGLTVRDIEDDTQERGLGLSVLGNCTRTSQALLRAAAEDAEAPVRMAFPLTMPPRTGAAVESTFEIFVTEPSPTFWYVFLCTDELMLEAARSGEAAYGSGGGQVALPGWAVSASLSLLNDGGTFRRQFSVQEFGQYEAVLIGGMAVAVLLLLMLCVACCSTYVGTAFLTMFTALTAVALVELTALVLLALESGIYAGDGEGFPLLRTLGQLLDVAQSVGFMLLAVAMVDGYGPNLRRMPARVKAGLGLAALCFAGGYAATEVVGNDSLTSAPVWHLYTSVPGAGVLALRAFTMVWFLLSSYSVTRESHGVVFTYKYAHKAGADRDDRGRRGRRGTRGIAAAAADGDADSEDVEAPSSGAPGRRVKLSAADNAGRHIRTHTSDAISENKRLHIVQAATMVGGWFATVPFTVLLAVAMPDYLRDNSVTVFTLFSNALGLCVGFVLMHPNRLAVVYGKGDGRGSPAKGGVGPEARARDRVGTGARRRRPRRRRHRRRVHRGVGDGDSAADRRHPPQPGAVAQSGAAAAPLGGTGDTDTTPPAAGAPTRAVSVHGATLAAMQDGTVGAGGDTNGDASAVAALAGSGSGVGSGSGSDTDNGGVSGASSGSDDGDEGGLGDAAAVDIGRGERDGGGDGGDVDGRGRRRLRIADSFTLSHREPRGPIEAAMTRAMSRTFTTLTHLRSRAHSTVGPEERGPHGRGHAPDARGRFTFFGLGRALNSNASNAPLGAAGATSGQHTDGQGHGRHERHQRDEHHWHSGNGNGMYRGASHATMTEEDTEGLVFVTGDARHHMGTSSGGAAAGGAVAGARVGPGPGNDGGGGGGGDALDAHIGHSERLASDQRRVPLYREAAADGASEGARGDTAGTAAARAGRVIALG